MKFKIHLFLLFAACLTIGCEDLEDTYSDYAGDGAIRYLGKMKDVTVHPGWKRLTVKWTNSVDPAISSIKVQWNLNGVHKDSVLAKDATECSIENLKDGNYEVSVFGMDKNGGTSLSLPLYARPYTEEHEVIRSFTRMVSKHVYLGDRLVLFFSDWQNNVDSASLNYYSPEGELKHQKLTSDFVKNNKYYLLPDAIDPTKEVSVDRRGRVEGCEDLITFAPYVLSHQKLYTTDFEQWAKEKHGQNEITDEWINSLVEIEFDYNLNSFEDLLNIPNLKTLVLGKGRYMNIENKDTISYSTLNEMERSLFTLNVLHELNELDVQRYGKHYFPKEVPGYVQEKGTGNTPPAVEFMDEKDWEFRCSIEDEGHYESYLEHLFDGDADTDWYPESKSGQPRTYVIEVNMKEVKEISGLRVLQNTFNPKDKLSRSYMPNIIKIEYSLNKLQWKNATHVEGNTLGVSNGEETYLSFKEFTDAQYLRFTIYDQSFGKNFSVKLAGIDVY